MSQGGAGLCTCKWDMFLGQVICRCTLSKRNMTGIQVGCPVSCKAGGTCFSGQVGCVFNDELDMPTGLVI